MFPQPYAAMQPTLAIALSISHVLIICDALRAKQHHEQQLPCGIPVVPPSYTKVSYGNDAWAPDANAFRPSTCNVIFVNDFLPSTQTSIWIDLSRMCSELTRLFVVGGLDAVVKASLEGAFGNADEAFHVPGAWLMNLALKSGVQATSIVSTLAYRLLDDGLCKNKPFPILTHDMLHGAVWHAIALAMPSTAQAFWKTALPLCDIPNVPGLFFLPCFHGTGHGAFLSSLLVNLKQQSVDSPCKSIGAQRVNYSFVILNKALLFCDSAPAQGGFAKCIDGVFHSVRKYFSHASYPSSQEYERNILQGEYRGKHAVDLVILANRNESCFEALQTSWGQRACIFMTAAKEQRCESILDTCRNVMSRVLGSHTTLINQFHWLACFGGAVQPFSRLGYYTMSSLLQRACSVLTHDTSWQPNLTLRIEAQGLCEQTIRQDQRQYDVLSSFRDFQYEPYTFLL